MAAGTTHCLDSRLKPLGLALRDLDYVAFSHLHFDHAGNAQLFKGLDFETVSGDAEFLPGVSFIQTPGHTPGSMSMPVDLPETGTMIFTADAVYDATLVFGHDSDQIKQLRVAPAGSYR